MFFRISQSLQPLYVIYWATGCVRMNRIAIFARLPAANPIISTQLCIPDPNSNQCDNLSHLRLCNI